MTERNLKRNSISADFFKIFDENNCSTITHDITKPNMTQLKLKLKLK